MSGVNRLCGTYATIIEVKEYLSNVTNTAKWTQDDQRIARFCEQMSRKFDAHCNRAFYPRKAIRYFDHPSTGLPSTVPTGYPVGVVGQGYAGDTQYRNYPGISANAYRTGASLNRLDVDDDLLEVFAFMTDNGNTTITSSNYYLKSGRSYNHAPYSRIELKYGGTPEILTWTGTPQQANTVSGVWGYHEQWADAWAQVDTVQDNPLLIGSTSLTVSDANGVDEQGWSPRFQIQQLARLGTGEDAEYVYLIDVNVSTNVLTIVRGVNGTTAAEWAQGTAIYLYRPMAEIKHAAEVLTVWAYRRKDSAGKEQDQPLAGSGILIVPSKLPHDVTSILDIYKRSPI